MHGWMHGCMDGWCALLAFMNEAGGLCIEIEIVMEARARKGDWER
jgi:hypothetical protein